jgi:hypothetical protein
MTQKIGNPVPIFIDARGTFMDDGNIYLGVANGDPQVSPIVAYWDAALTQVAAQPIKTLGGFIVNGTAMAEVFIAQSDYSMRMTDAFDVQVFYSPSVQQAGLAYQPLDSDLTTISGQSNQSFGLSLLTLANSAALAAATGLSNFTGGTVTTNIVRQGAGVYPYWSDSAMTGGRFFITAVGASDPTSQPADCWFQY